MAIKKEALAQVKKQQAAAEYLHAIDPNFAKTGFTLGDVSKLKTINPGADPYAVADEYGNVPDTSYQQDSLGRRVSFSPNQGVDNEGNPQGSPEYRQLTNIGGKQIQVTYDDKGNFKSAIGDDITKNGHKFTPIYDQRGNIVKYEDAGGDGFSDFAKMVALSALTAGVGSAFGGASGLGNSLYGLTGTAGQIAGGATLGAGRAAITGGDIFKGALTGGIGGAGNLGIGDTGFTVGQAMTAVNALKAAEKGDWMNAITGAASLSGAGNTQIGDTGYTLGDLAKNAKLAQAVLSGNPQAIIGAITRVAGSANQDIIQSLTDAGMSRPQANDFIEGYFAPGGEGYIAPTQQNFPPETKGDWDEIAGKFVPNENGGTTYGQINPQTSGNIENMKDWSFDKTTGGWTHTDPVTGETTVYDYRTPITGTALTGAQIEKNADAQIKTTTPVGGTKTTIPATQTITPTASTTTASAPTTTRVGLDPLDVAKMKNDVAHIKAMEELFGGSIYDQTPASSAHDQTDIVEAATGGQVYSGGGDIHALLQLLRS